MNRKVSENSTFINNKNYEIRIHAWFCIQNATIDYKGVPWLILRLTVICEAK